jgi:hypothetical protein
MIRCLLQADTAAGTEDGRRVGLPWPRSTLTPDGVRVTSHSPVPDRPGPVA